MSSVQHLSEIVRGFGAILLIVVRGVVRPLKLGIALTISIVNLPRKLVYYF